MIWVLDLTQPHHQNPISSYEPLLALLEIFLFRFVLFRFVLDFTLKSCMEMCCSALGKPPHHALQVTSIIKTHEFSP